MTKSTFFLEWRNNHQLLLCLFPLFRPSFGLTCLIYILSPSLYPLLCLLCCFNTHWTLNVTKESTSSLHTLYFLGHYDGMWGWWWSKEESSFHFLFPANLLLGKKEHLGCRLLFKEIIGQRCCETYVLTHPKLDIYCRIYFWNCLKEDREMKVEKSDQWMWYGWVDLLLYGRYWTWEYILFSLLVPASLWRIVTQYTTSLLQYHKF